MVLDESADWDVRQLVIQGVDDFARKFVHEVGVDVQFVDAASAEHAAPVCA